MKSAENMPLSENSDISADYLVDATQMKCPLPLLKMKQALNQASVGEVVFVRCTDPTSQRDFKSFIDMTEHELRIKQVKNEFHYWVTKKA
ncbi:sulfurtransferase TusA family protein [Aliikangiella marina]|uniref:Sulfurtransferase TusA family protein n=1 Tax=Aliikangiella marina TaxID=1712262 RepID=A0A545TK04_9GAMM|nr:sulfurtransferase TusA family protein [Aliikangiella marina]TQV77491.1 sulfurtransferase TusA family protein [Aliikangiella marina]